VSFCQIPGCSEADRLARSVHEITHPDDIECDLLQEKRALAGEIETYQAEKRYIHRSGRIAGASSATATTTRSTASPKRYAPAKRSCARTPTRRPR
jgi:PAS domain S-box-containing protein